MASGNVLPLIFDITELKCSWVNSSRLLFKSDSTHSSRNYAAVCIAMHVSPGVDLWAFCSLFSPAVTYYVHTAASSSPTYQLAWLWGAHQHAQWRVIAHYSSAFKVMIKTRQIPIAVSGISKLFFNFVKWAIEKLVKLQWCHTGMSQLSLSVLNEWKKTCVKYKQWYLTIFFIQRANSLVWLN